MCYKKENCSVEFTFKKLWEQQLLMLTVLSVARSLCSTFTEEVSDSAHVVKTQDVSVRHGERASLRLLTSRRRAVSGKFQIRANLCNRLIIAISLIGPAFSIPFDDKFPFPSQQKSRTEGEARVRTRDVPNESIPPRLRHATASQLSCARARTLWNRARIRGLVDCLLWSLFHYGVGVSCRTRSSWWSQKGCRFQWKHLQEKRTVEEVVCGMRRTCGVHAGNKDCKRTTAARKRWSVSKRNDV